MVIARRGLFNRTTHLTLASVLLLAMLMLGGQLFKSVPVSAAEDTTAPNFSIADNVVIGGASTDVIVTDEALNSVTLDGEDATFAGAAPSYTVSVSGEGSHTLIATDQAGNTSQVVFTLDATAPTVMLDDIASVIVGNGIVVSGSVNDPGVNTVEVRVDGNVVNDTVPVNAEAFNYTVDGLAVGSYAVTVAAKDTVGNEGVSDAKTAIVM